MRAVLGRCQRASVWPFSSDCSFRGARRHDLFRPSLKKARVITRLASEEIRLRALASCRALANFDLVAVLNEGLKRAERIIEEKQRLARIQEALAENSSDQSDARSENPPPGDTVSTDS